MEGYHFENLWIHDLENQSVNPVLRVVGMRIELNTSGGTNDWYGGYPWGYKATTQRVENGYIKNVRIENLKAYGAGAPGNSCQGIWYQLRDIDPLWDAIIYHEGNVINNVTGVEAEGMYLDEYTWQTNNKIDVNNTKFEFQNDSIYDCEDRAMKSVVSNVTINNGYYASINPAIATPQGGAIINVFTLRNNSVPAPTESHRSRNIRITNNIFDQPYGQRQQSLNTIAIDGLTVSGNTFQASASGNYPAIMLGVFLSTPPTTAVGQLENATFSGNTYTNMYLEINRYFQPQNVVFDNETFNMNWTGSGGDAAGAGLFSYNGLGVPQTVDGFTVRNSTGNVTISAAGDQFHGWFSSQNTSVANTLWENLNLNYTSPFTNAVNAEFMWFRGNFDSSNSITNLTMTNASGTGSLKIAGTRTVQIINSTGDGVPITVQ